MNELITINTNENQEPVISGRELHRKLDVKTRYNDWFNRMCEYGFEENHDFIAITQKRVTAQHNETSFIDHAIKLDMAKEICMIQRKEKYLDNILYKLKKILTALRKLWLEPCCLLTKKYTL